MEIFESELKNVKKCNLFVKEKVTIKWTRYEVMLSVLTDLNIQWMK